MRAAVTWALAVAAFLVAAVAFVGAFSSFRGAPDPPVVGSPDVDEYEADQARRAQVGTALGLFACFALLAGLGLAQRGWRQRTGS